MGTATFSGTGNWGDAGRWSGGTGTNNQPISTEDAIIAAGAVCTLNGTTPTCKTLTLTNGSGANAGGKFVKDTTAASKLTCLGITNNGTTGSGAGGNYATTLDFDMTSAPTVTCELVLNNTGTTGTTTAITMAGIFNLKGAVKKRHTTITSAVAAGDKTCTVADATGWVVGDKLIFATTSAYVSAATVSISNATWSGGLLTCTTASTAELIQGANITLSGFTTASINGPYVVASVPSGTTFTVAIAVDPVTYTGTRLYSLQAKTDEVTIDTVNTGTGVVTWIDGAGGTVAGGLAYAHASGAPIGNFTSNLIIRPATTGKQAFLNITATTGQPASSSVTDVELRGMLNGFAQGAITINGATSTNLASISNNAFYNNVGSGSNPSFYTTGTGNPNILKQYNIFYSWSSPHVGGSDTQGTAEASPDYYYAIFRQSVTAAAIQVGYQGQHQIGHKISGHTIASSAGGAIHNATAPSTRIEDCAIWSCNSAISSRAAVSLDNVTFGSANFSGCDNLFDYFVGPCQIVAKDCIYPTNVLITGMGSGLPGTTLQLVNRSVSGTPDPGVQEIYGSHSNTLPIISRVTSGYPAIGEVGPRSTSALQFESNASTAITYDIDIPAKASTALKILVCVAKNAAYNDAAYTLPSATLSGLGITPVSASGTDVDDTWELLTLDLASGSAPTTDGVLTLTLSSASATAGAKAWFAGVTATPFVSRVRHYGYLLDETSPTRTADITASASFATADAYSPGQMTFSWSATAGSSTSTIVTDSTFQQLYDGHQAQACLNVGSAVAMTGAGVAGSPALFAAGNVTISTTKTLNGAGSLSIPSGKTLTADVPWAFTYTNGTYSKADSSANATFAGGTLNIGAAGTYTFTQASAMTVNVTPTAPGNYAFGDSTFTGTLTVNNATAHAVVIEVPSGTSTATSTPAVVTFSAPIVTADISITGMPDVDPGVDAAPTRLQIINSTAVSAADWTANTVYATGDVVLRTSGIGSENTAGLYFRATTGGTSHATTEPTWDTTVGNTTSDNTVTWTTYAILYYDADPAATSLTDTYIDGEEFLAGETVEIRFAEEYPAVSFKTYSTSVIATADGFSALVNEEADSVYATYALSGADQDATFSPNYAASYIVLDANINFAGTEAFAYYCYLLTTSEGMYRFWGGLTALDSGNIRNNTATISLYFDESAGFVRQTDDVRIFRDDGLRPALDPTTGGAGIEINWRVPVNVVSTGGSALTTEEHNALLALPSASTVASTVATQSQSTPFHADARKMNGATITGTGVDSDLWRGA